MKVRIDIECTPDEARSFCGLPPVSEMQTEMMAGVAERVRDAMSESDPEALMRAWMPSGMEGLEQMQKAFWSATQKATGSTEKE